MNYKIVPIGIDAIKVTNKIFTKLEIANVLIVQIPDKYIPMVESYVEELQKAFPSKHIVVTSKKIKFCELKRKK